ncbi:unnamed protein product [Arctia plantaginis]|uniref:Solute carrier family 12 member 9 n=1 Tax=Arctia plantaginis TaxID=874455 RepID=A0A8S1BJZ3_ARCPL|nr:unnamed protein product [Arctia plantaginis]
MLLYLFQKNAKYDCATCVAWTDHFMTNNSSVTKPTMTETLDPLSPSTNSFGRTGVMTKLRMRFGRAPVSRPAGDGYVEFGEFRSERAGVKKVGTFAGVFCPVVLSMFSALVFIRMGYLVGNAGLLVTLGQFALAYLIVVFTVTSICAICTNGAVEGGGVYFMISRTLGPECGGAVGSLFFFANVVSSALCISACTEALVENFGPNGYLVGSNPGIPDGWWYRFLYRTILNAIGLGVSLAGASLFARTSLAIWVTILICLSSALISFFVTPPAKIDSPDTNRLVNTTAFNYTGLSSATLYENLFPSYAHDYTADGQLVDFASVFGVLFTGVTGVMAGANMSGELKNPSRSIPWGTLSALVFTALWYVALSVLTAATCSRELLQNNYVYLLPINVWPPFIAVGMLMATFSAGLSNLIGASRVLEALAKDNIFGSLLRPMVSRSSNPVLAVLTSWLLVQIGIMADSLNAIAQVNSVLFMTSYLAINLSCLGLDLASAPNFRPTFKQFSWVTSLLGFAGCVALMFGLRALYACGAALACGALVVALHLLSPAAADPTWGSLSQALIFHQVRKYLLLLDPRREHVKFWRPQMLLLVASPRHSAPLIDFVNDQKKGGLFVVGHVRVGELCGAGDPLADEHKYWLKLIDHLKVKAFVELSLARSVREGAAQLARLAGLGAMKPDTVLLGFRDAAPPRDFFRDPVSPYKTEQFDLECGEVIFPPRGPLGARLSAAEYVRIVSDVLCVNKNVCLCRHFHRLDMAAVERRCPSLKYIDVWLVELMAPSCEEPFTVRGLFALQLAAVVRSARGWQHLALRLRAVAGPAAPPPALLGNLPPPLAPASLSSPSINARLLLFTEAGRTVTLGPPALAGLAPAAPYALGERLERLTKLLRINATTHIVNEWPDPQEFSRRGSDEGRDTYQNVSLDYLQVVNSIIKRSSEATAVTFVQLPSPPPLSPQGSPSDDLVCEQYLKVLDEFTKELPPTILVRGLKSVTSTSL